MRAGGWALCLAALLGCGESPGPGATGGAGTGAGGLGAAGGGAGTNGTPKPLPTVTGTYTLTSLAGEVDMVDHVNPRDGIGAAAHFFVSPVSMAVDGAGLLYAVDSTLRSIDPSTGAVTTVAVKQAASPRWPLTSPQLVTANAAGGIFAACPALAGATLDGGGLLQLRDAALEPLLPIRGFLPLALAADVGGVFFVQAAPQAFAQRQIVFADLVAAKVIEVVANVGPLVAEISGFAGDGAGTLFLSDASACVIVQRPPTGEAVVVAGEKGTCAYVDGADAAARLGEPRALVSDGANGLYVLDGPTLRRVDRSTGSVTTLLGASSSGKPEVGSPGRLYRPTSLALLPGGRGVAVADSHAIFVAAPPPQ